ncbi:MAG: DUF2158 domain-containing protein [Flavobacterium sp.]|nr:MAG: DUF2158 domain-containing protein [Flavobacterium sp.]
MDEESFYIGDLVVLKSGGPIMTITSFHMNVPVCSYFVNGKLETFKTFGDNLKKATIIDDDK